MNQATNKSRRLAMGEHCPHGRFILLDVFVVALMCAQTLAQDLPRAEFADNHRIDDDAGHISLKWGAEGEDLEYEVQDAMEPDFAKPSRVYLGGDEASFQSGLSNGTYYYRVRAREAGTETWGPWSEPLEFVCEHHSLWSALGLFVSGAVLFVLLVFFVVVNASDLRRFEDDRPSAEQERQHA